MVQAGLFLLLPVLWCCVLLLGGPLLLGGGGGGGGMLLWLLSLLLLLWSPQLVLPPCIPGVDCDGDPFPHHLHGGVASQAVICRSQRFERCLRRWGERGWQHTRAETKSC
jgi:hypothetical protein